MKKRHSIIIFIGLLALGCRAVSTSNSTTAIKIINPYSIKRLTTKLNNVNPYTFNLNSGNLTISALYVSKKQISVEEYFTFINDISKNIETEKISDSLSYYIDIVNSPIKLVNNQFTMTSADNDIPMTYVSYKGASEYCNWLSEKYCHPLSLPNYRLPTEYEWMSAFEQNKIKSSQKNSICDWVQYSNCIVKYQPIVERDCIEFDFLGRLPFVAAPDSAIVKSMVGKKNKQHGSHGFHKAKLDSTIGFRIAQTRLYKKYGFEF